MTIEKVKGYTITNEEVIVHPTILRKDDKLMIDARVVIAIEIDGVKYLCNKVSRFFLSSVEGGDNE